ncbi:hypothetical protein Snoj_18660 [Streptomyces nojiriensis]|uniref:HEAT repeat domain-containing protein n=1 Tax=Streptomyces nojiriensis TaxID=66374 RepID=A0ABQ3SIH4_9ACTN|nr:hypothetical protein [Streptomyces nojiriensis]QTI49561.1 hypothetical protein JYK04_07433 [Streptomyces nojiriensis]GGS24685.1 hypothetical protein GCM10010205_63390 [Streptomyces nojiriensis]GHI67948.1 hypothetical protein Snoj_18660 [Streptomyces nojiriensis]
MAAKTIKKLTPEAGRTDTAGLRAFDADALARCAADAAQPWWRRQACAEALAGRVPERRVPELIARVQDTGDVSHVRIALLGLLADRSELLPWLRHEDRQQDGAYGMAEAVLGARGALGDLTAAGALATLAFNPWRHRRETGEAGLDALAARYGCEAVLAELDGARPEDRSTGVRLRHHAGEDVTDALADPDRAVAYRAQEFLTDPERLRGYLAGAPTEEAKLWAVYALHRLTEDTAETRRLYEELGRPRVEVPGLDEELRTAIVHEYGQWAEERSDPRWRIEAVCAEPPQAYDPAGPLLRATAALTAAGLAPKPPVSCGEDNGSGDGTYHVIGYGESDVAVFISTLGRFATGDDEDPDVRRALESAGFRWIDRAVASIEVTGLCVYHFGSRNPLKVDTLLFYWQD